MVRKNRIVVTKERKVNIVDSKKPVITLEGEETVKICPNKEYVEDENGKKIKILDKIALAK